MAGGFESPLAALAEGLQRNKDNQMKQARELANKHADEWERQFKTQQAATQAKEAQQRYAQETQRIAIEKQGQERLAAKDKADQAYKDKQAETNKFKAKAYADHLLVTDSLKDSIEVRKIAAKEIINLTDKGIDPDIAVDMALEMARRTQGGIRPPGSGNPLMGGQQPQVQGQPQYGSLDYLNMLQGQGPQQGQGEQPPQAGVPPQATVRGPFEIPDAFHQMLPKIKSDIAKATAETGAAGGREARDRSIAAVNNATSKYTEAIKGEEFKKKQADANKATVEAKQALEKGEAELGLIKAHAVTALDQSAKTRWELSQQKHLAPLKEKELRKKIAADRGGTLKDLRSDQNKYLANKVKLQKDIGNEVEAISGLGAIFERGYLEGVKDTNGKPKYTPQQIQTMRATNQPSMDHHIAMQKSLVKDLAENEANINRVTAAIQEAGKITVTTPSGAADHKATQKSVEGHKAEAKNQQRKADAPPRSAAPNRGRTQGIPFVNAGGQKADPKPAPRKRKQLQDYDGYRVYEGK